MSSALSTYRKGKVSCFNCVVPKLPYLNAFIYSITTILKSLLNLLTVKTIKTGKTCYYDEVCDENIHQKYERMCNVKQMLELASI